jgi:hypothetical protein
MQINKKELLQTALSQKTFYSFNMTDPSELLIRAFEIKDGRVYLRPDRVNDTEGEWLSVTVKYKDGLFNFTVWLSVERPQPEIEW